MSVETLVSKSKKRVGNVHPVVWKYGEDLIRQAYKKGLYIMFSDGHRTAAQQNALFAQGRTKPGKIVTNARAGQSLHNYGVAFDMFITNKNGTSASWDTAKLNQAGQMAEQLGFEWGGRWKSIVDRPHIQMTGGLSLAQLQAGKKPNLKYKGKTIDYTPSSGGSSGGSSYTSVASKWTGQNLKKWHKGGAVKQLQKLVGVKADGYFGADTVNAVKKAQKKHGLAVDGIAGKDTYKALTGKKSSKKKANLKVDGRAGKSTVKAIQKATGSKYKDGVFSGQPSNSVTKAFYSGISYGSGGSPSVKLLQKKVGSSQDGKLGADTIRKLQKHLGTTVDGVISRPSSAVIKELQKRLSKGTF